jgi:hypothetical protein
MARYFPVPLVVSPHVHAQLLAVLPEVEHDLVVPLWPEDLAPATVPTR